MLSIIIPPFLTRLIFESESARFLEAIPDLFFRNKLISKIQANKQYIQHEGASRLNFHFLLFTKC